MGYMEKNLSQKARQVIAIRDEASITQAQLAQLLGVSLRTVSRWEQGVTEVPDGTVDRIKYVLNKPRPTDRALIAGGTNVDIGMEVMDRLRRLDDLQSSYDELKEVVEAYRVKYGPLGV